MTLPRVPLLKMNGKQTVAYFAELLRVAGVEDANALASSAAQAIVGGITPPAQTDLEERWYRSVAGGTPDYTVYEEDAYLVEAVYCWFEMSRRYLQRCGLTSSLPPGGIWSRLKDAKLVVDLGNGLGFTSAALRVVLPKAQVVGTNVVGSTQYRVASVLADVYGFTMVEHPVEVDGTPDLVWATEYFEHFDHPTDHADEVLEALRPRALIVQNTFNEDATGHFSDYIVGGEVQKRHRVGKVWNDNLIAHGYRQVDTKMWNRRPSLWVQEEGWPDGFWD